MLFARSFDNGVTWSPPSAVNTNAASDAGDDLRPQIATDRKGTWMVVWQSTDTLGGLLETDEDILFAISTNEGATWTTCAAVLCQVFLHSPCPACIVPRNRRSS